ncbi:MAG: energy-coupling factor transporter ATPase [Emergencia timonensis]|uniref:energy-coupling factor transporter ATPase n=1 Tax=Emergencia timonensis TaxID=1776384 RepID=UPI0008302126|nr:energy-coupling factor transporter ATPase [Emergencia timonensis]WNX88537.1 energy-coupling factor transporter ATPase [Emergencia timonensis]
MSIQVRNLSHIYSKGMPDEQLALSNINFDIYDGEIVGVIGHTGSGKSTLLQHLNGLLKPDSGTIMIGNTDITAPGVALKEIRRRVGLVFQYPEYQLFEETVAQDVAFGPKNLGLSEAEIADRVEEALELVGLDYEDIKDRSPFDLSGGQKRRVAIAGVIAMKPHVLILDEPTAGLDPGAHQDILEMIEEVHGAQNNNIIFVSHNMADVASLSDKVMVLDNGKLVMVGTPQEVFSQKQRLESIGLNVPPVTNLMYQLKAGGISINENVLTLKEAEEELYNYLQRKMI